jgi:hypothetical protein
VPLNVKCSTFRNERVDLILFHTQIVTRIVIYQVRLFANIIGIFSKMVRETVTAIEI